MIDLQPGIFSVRGPGQVPESSYFKYLKILRTPVFGELSRAVSTGMTTIYENIIIDSPLTS